MGSCSISSSMKAWMLPIIFWKPLRLWSMMMLFLRLRLESSDITESDLSRANTEDRRRGPAPSRGSATALTLDLLAARAARAALPRLAPDTALVSKVLTSGCSWMLTTRPGLVTASLLSLLPSRVP